MKKFLMFVCALSFIGCDGIGFLEAPEDGASCTVAQADGGALVICEDGTEVFLPDGSNGASGSDGINGEDGTNGADGEDGLGGSDGLDGSNGTDGVDGNHGLDGLDGVDGDIIFQDYIISLVGKTESIVDIWVADVDGNNLGRCTGAKTINDTVVTASHCFPTTAVNFAYYQESVIVGTFGVVDPYGVAGRDIVEVKEISWSDPGKLIPGLVPIASSVAIGDMVGDVSLPLMIYNDVQITVGFVTDDNLNESIQGLFWEDSFMADYAAAGGSSGSPVFNSSGEWIGIHVGGFNESLELSIALPFR